MRLNDLEKERKNEDTAGTQTFKTQRDAFYWFSLLGRQEIRKTTGGRGETLPPPAIML
jgi:hypothetical protein